MGKIAFLGDFVLTEIGNAKHDYFVELSTYLNQNKIETCINLESPVVTSEMKKIKEKIALKCLENEISFLKSFYPRLVNLSNNHINDFGNASAELTMASLARQNIKSFGIGLLSKKGINNIVVDEESKIVMLSYTTRSSDFTGSKLFAENEFIGPYDIDLDEIKIVRNRFKDYFIFVNIHWGIENIIYPEPEKRNLGYKIIDAGADMIIGHHPHIVQACEIYNGKYIFYSIGNFYFPPITYELNGKTEKLILQPHQRTGIIPVVKTKNREVAEIEILQIVNLTTKQEVSILSGMSALIDISNLTTKYIFMFKLQALRIYLNRVFRFLTNPKRIYDKIKRMLIFSI